MKLSAEQLDSRLSRALAPSYVVHGDEPLLVQEAAEAIRSAACAQGYVRECFFIDASFAWETLLQSFANLSLFATRRLLEVRIGTVKLGDDATKTLQTYAEDPPENTLLLLICGKLDVATQQSAWFTALEAVGVTVTIRPVTIQQMPGWIEKRMRTSGLHPNAKAVALLAESAEGNLLGAAQEIERLRLLFGKGSITAQEVRAVMSDSARYTIYALTEAALGGFGERVVRILRRLRSEGVEAALLSWALHREIRLLNVLDFELSQGKSLERALADNRVWDKHKLLVQKALQGLTQEACRRLLSDCARLDRLIKGLEQGDPWNELLNLSLRLAGHKIP
jgi:DNA polymerase-3 subunit delta